MSYTPISEQIISAAKNSLGIRDLGTATIREIKKIVDLIETESAINFVRMEMGIPGLPAAPIAIESEIQALRDGVAAIYPDIMGVKDLKTEISRFAKNFLDIDISPEGCVPTVGSMQGGYASFMTLGRIHEGKDTVLFLDPGFPVHKQQIKVMGGKFEQFDVYDYRGEKLSAKLESILSKGNIHSILYSNPNNPTWICFTETELKIIAEAAAKYDVVVVEDLAYIAMDFRKEYSKPGEPPYQPSIAKYYDNYILLISSSKSFSYAGQRVGMMLISDALYNAEFPALLRYYKLPKFGYSMIFGSLYALSSGTSHSAQYGLLGVLKAVNNGEYNFVEVVKEYGKKAEIMKKLFLDNGFNIVYDKDEDMNLADGFYFTIAYPGMSGGELLEAFMAYGISAIALATTGSERTEGIRACVSLVKREQFPALEERLKAFHAHFSA
ncbi:MAG: pyridoxal phosphate-dependent aminotransferase [Bacteroidales bacterium]|nr:pyridoxal phosphate-dependent aminotransferase [Bacteroidales bacterium]